MVGMLRLLQGMDLPDTARIGVPRESTQRRGAVVRGSWNSVEARENPRVKTDFPFLCFTGKMLLPNRMID